MATILRDHRTHGKPPLLEQVNLLRPVAFAIHSRRRETDTNGK